MNDEDREQQVIHLLRELVEAQERQLPPPELSPFQRNALLREVERTLAQPQPRSSLWELWHGRFFRVLPGGAAAALVLAAAVTIVATRQWPFSSTATSGVMELALQWPAASSFDAAVVRAWRSQPITLPQDMPDFTLSTGTLGAPAEARYTRWRLATVMVRTADGFGSGALLSRDGWIVTDYQVVAGAAQRSAVQGTPAIVQVVTARLLDGSLGPREPVKATLWRADARLNLALLKLEALPAGVTSLPFFLLANQVRAGEECFVVGSQPNAAAWWLRSGNLIREFEYPRDFGQSADLERTRVTLLATDVRTAPGDAGGPWLNAQGELIGVTFGTRPSSSVEAEGWAIALKHLRAFVADLPSRPEGVPWDPWTAGLPYTVISKPEPGDTDSDGRIDCSRYHHVDLPTAGPADAPQPAVAFTLFADLAQRTAPAGNALDAVPAGLWGMEERGRFRFDVFFTVRADGVAAVGYANRQGIVDEVRVGRAREASARVLWRRDENGRWHSRTPGGGTPLVDTARFGPSELRRLRAITGGILAPPTPPPVPNSPRP
jgi:S1-C subfamily serine protease